MKAPTIDKSPATKKKKTSSKRSTAALATCPVNGAGWCPYPFSIEQLERRLKAKAQAEEDAKKAEEAKKVHKN